MRELRSITAAGAILTLLCTGCTTPGAPSLTPIPTGSPSSSATVTPTPPPSPSTPTDPAAQQLAAAKQRVVDMWAVVDEISIKPKKSINALDAYATGEWLTKMQIMLSEQRALKYTTVGLSSVEITSGKRLSSKSWSVEACVDTSAQKVLDKKGKRVDGPPFKVLHRATVVQAGAQLKISQDEAVTEC